MRLTGLDARGDSIRDGRKALDKLNFGFLKAGRGFHLREDYERERLFTSEERLSTSEG